MPGLEQRPHTSLTNCQCSDRVNLLTRVAQTRLSAQPKLTPVCFRQPLCVNPYIIQRRTHGPSPKPFTTPLRQHSTILLSFPHKQPIPFLKTTVFSHFSMTDQSVSSRFRTLFESALEDYEIKTKISLEKHPLAQKLENCHSVESITTLLQDQARSFEETRGRDRITKSIRSTVSFLYKLSATAGLGDDLGLVC